MHAQPLTVGKGPGFFSRKAAVHFYVDLGREPLIDLFTFLFENRKLLSS